LLEAYKWQRLDAGDRREKLSGERNQQFPTPPDRRKGGTWQ
jgi:hypothetical protein